VVENKNEDPGPEQAYSFKRSLDPPVSVLQGHDVHRKSDGVARTYHP